MRVRVPVGSLWQYWWSIYSDILQYQYDIYNYCLCVFLIGYLVKMAYLLPLVNRNPWLDPSYDGHSTYSHTESIPCCCQVYYIWWSWHYCMHWHHYELHNYYLNKYCEKNNSIHIYTRRIRILTMMTVAQLTCMEAYCLWMYVCNSCILAAGHSCIPGYLYWVALHFTGSFFGILDQFQHCFSQMLVFPWLIVDMCWDSHIKFALDSLNRYL